ncbi:MAG: hypothetical protein U9R74_07065 [Pseudomonadota bacterium]|nr:hypothetical protein [Pseudomonadota bacterium]
MKQRIPVIATLVTTLFLGTQLVACGGGGAEVKTTGKTQGQELLDLDKAYKEGIITESQYNKAKKEILQRKY